MALVMGCTINVHGKNLICSVIDMDMFLSIRRMRTMNLC